MSTRVVVDGADVRVVTAGAGQPSVFFDTALGMPLEAWSLVAPSVAAFTRVILWDRPGIGESSVGPPLGGHAVADAMATVIDQAGGEGVIAVGHSRGGLNVLCFALAHPELIRGVVLVEPSYPDYARHMRGSAEDPLLRVAKGLASVPSWLPGGVALAARAVASVVGSVVSPGARLMADIAPLVARRVGAIAAESDARGELVTEAEELMRKRTFPPVPLVVLTGAHNMANSPADAAEWRGMHAELAGLSPEGAQCLVECGHDVPFSRPDAVISAIEDVFNRVHP